MSSSFYDKQFAHLRIPLEEILSATSNFSSANFIRKDGFGWAYRGQLLRSGQLIDVVAHRLDPESNQHDKEFWTEVTMLSTLNHENLVTMIGFCDQDREKIIIYSHKRHGSLDEYISDPTNLTWMRRLQICVGVARALSYIHYDKGRDFSVIHRNLKSSKVLLDDKWKPKLFGFQLSMKYTAARRHRLLQVDNVSGTIGYMDPRYEKSGGVTYKSDVYSFGVLLFEVLCGRTAFIIPEPFSSNSAKQHSEKESQDVVGRLDEIMEHEGRSPQFAEQHLIDESLDVVGKIDDIFEHPNNKKPGAAVNMDEIIDPRQTNEEGPPSWPPSLSNLPAVIGPPSVGNIRGPVMQPSSVSDITEPAGGSSFSGYALELPPSEPEISDISMEQRPVLTPLHMCTFIIRGRHAHLHIPDGELLAPLAILHYEERKLDEMIDRDLWKQMDPQSFNVFSEIAYHCLREQRSERPEIDQIVTRLEKALDLQQRHENFLTLKERLDVATEVKGPSTNHLEWENLEHFKIGFHDIELATENFSQTHCIGSGAYGKVYKAELEHLDSQNSSERDLAKISSTVAIKCIFKREDTQDKVGFSAEIKTLTSCKHPNIVSLLGFCDEESQMILVYEYVSRGSLDDYLSSIDNMTNRKWVQRLHMCLDIAQGLNYLHNEQRIIHRDIKSDNILLDDNWVAKIADFGLSKIGPMSQQASYLETTVAGTSVYLDPEYMKTRKLKKASDIYSFGVVLFEIMSGTLAYDKRYMKENDKGLAPFARQHFHNGTLKDMLDPKLKEEFDENIFTLTKGPNQDSLDTFLDIAYQCLAETQAQRPKIGTVIKQLKKALYFQENHKDILKISLEDIKLATDNFSKDNFIGEGGFGMVYKGEVTNANGRHTSIAAKRLYEDSAQGKTQFLTELEILLEYKHENIIGFVGYCEDMGENIIVYEHASRGSLDEYVGYNGLGWMKRLQICIDIVSGLDFLHENLVIHRDIKSGNILLNDDWKAKVTDFGLTSIASVSKDMDFVFDGVRGTEGYVDPLYHITGVTTRESDIYSLGVLLFEMLSGKLAYDDKGVGFLGPLVEQKSEDGILDEMVFEGIKKQIAPKSLATFQCVALRCIHRKREERPTTGEVLLRLQEALEFQEDYEIWKPKLPTDYEKLIQMSNTRVNCSTEKYKDLYDMFSNGILLNERKVFFSLGGNGERREMISATKFSYKHPRLQKWRSVPESRFDKVAKMLDISNLKIQVRITPQFLSPGVNYGVYLVFKFCEPRKSVAKRMYVNLKYKKGRETLHTYFTKWREDGWMMIELYRFLKHTEDTDFEFLLERFSRCYCESHDIYIQGIEFRAIENVKYEECKNLEEVQHVQKSNLNMDQVQQLPTNSGKLLSRFENYGKSEQFPRNKVNKKQSYMLSAKEALYKSSDVKLFNSALSAQSRSQDVIELLSLQVFRIKCKIECQRLSTNTQYACYLVYKLSEKCHGLHCPVIVRDLLQRCKNKEKGIIYFRTPSPCNVHDTDSVPEEREDGWMEVNVWQFSLNYDLQKDCIPVSLKLISYEGTMSGLIVSSLEFRPI